MIKLNKLNKYFYKGESREIHVINDCTIDLPDTGLVTFLGASGSGKTTLLNVIGGLDKVDNGTITYDEEAFTNKDRSKIDEYRKNNIGYIFQNYLLFNEKSVYNNLKEALEIVGVYDEEEQRKRIEYALEKVNMFKFRRKKVRNLSGGQMQRVSIARALVKDAKIIIADEPTGNIDSNNTIEVMNILKKLSETTLVILVTHEESIANYYSDRIINIKDGKIISDETVTKRKKLNNENDQKIYLLDYEKEESNSDKLNVELYYDNKATASNVQIIVKNNTIYIKSDKKIVNLNESSISLVNEKYQDYEVDAKLTNEETFDTSWYKTTNTKKNWFVRFFKNLGQGFVDYFSGKKSYVFFMIIFIILGAITASSCINLIKYTNYNSTSLFDEDGYYFVLPNDYEDTSYYTSGTPYLDDYAVIKKGFEKGYFNDYLCIESEYVTFDIKQSIVNKFTSSTEIYKCKYNNQDLICGKAPKSNQCIIGKKLADKVLKDLDLSSDNYAFLIGKDVGGYQCSGVAKIETNMVYVTANNLPYIEFPINNYSYYKRYIEEVVEEEKEEPIEVAETEGEEPKTIKKVSYEPVGDYESNKKYIIKLVSGKYPENSDEIIVSSIYMDQFELNSSLPLYIENNKSPKDGKSFKIVGFYENNYEEGYNILSIDSDLIGRYLYYNLAFSTRDYYHYNCVSDTEYVLLSGERPIKDNEVLANINSGCKIGDLIYDMYKVTGIYDVNEKYKENNNYVDYIGYIISGPMTYYDYVKQSLAYKIDDAKLEEVESFLKENDSQLISVNKYQNEAIEKEFRRTRILNIVLTIFLIGLVVLFTYLTARSKMIKQIYSIGVYRSLGKSKKDIKKQAIYISVAQTTTSSLVGYVLVICIYLYLGKNYIDLISDFTTKPLYLLLGIPVLYAINIVFSLIPYNALLRKTPSQINSKFDI